MSLPYFPFYSDRFEAATSHLTIEEDGVYNRLLRLCWVTLGMSIPDSDQWIMRRMRVDAATFSRVVSPIISEFFVRESGRFVSPFISECVEQHRKSQSRPWVPLMLQRLVFERDGSVCTYCRDTKGPFHLDHIYPWALGGQHTAENLTVACARCNWSKGGKTLSEWRGQ